MRVGNVTWCPTVVEPAILEAVEGVEQGHVQQANHLSNGVDGEEADHHTLVRITASCTQSYTEHLQSRLH